MEELVTIKAGDIVKFIDNAKYPDGTNIPSQFIEKEWIVDKVNDNKLSIVRSTDDDISVNLTVTTDNVILIQGKVITLYTVCKELGNNDGYIGLYTQLENATQACDLAGPGYSIYDMEGNVIYHLEPDKIQTFKVGDAVSLIPGAKYSSGAAISEQIIQSKLYIRSILENGNYVISYKKTGMVNGVVTPADVVPYGTYTGDLEPYIVLLLTDTTVHIGAHENYKVKTTLKKNNLYTIVEEKNNWGRLKSGDGWINLENTKKL